MTKTETHTNKTILRALLAGVAVLLLCGAAVGAAAGAGGDPYQIGDKYANTLQNAYNTAADGDTIKVLTNVTESEEQNLTGFAKSVILDLNGWTISAGDKISSTSYLICWGNTGTLTITDTTEEKKGTLSGGNKTQVLRISSGTVEMTAGTITGGNAHSGGGVCVNSGEFTMSGSASVTGNTSDQSGGGVYVNDGEFTMSGSASVTGNTSMKKGGGGVYISGGTFTMSDSASIIGNTATEGGGVYVYYGTFTMNGGTIGGSAAADANTATEDGGGVYVTRNGKFKMSGSASIIGNTAKSNGGGVYVYENGVFYVSGSPEITGNTATEGGGGVYVFENGYFNVSGAPDISGNTKGSGAEAPADNVFLTIYGEKVTTITVTAPLTGGQIWIQSPLSKESPYNNFAKGVGGSESYTVKSTDAQYFHPDDETRPIKAAVTSGTKTYANSTLGWVEAEKVAEIKGGNKYTSVQAAVKAATAGDTIIMIADSTEPTVVVDKKVTLDLNGKVLKNPGSGSVINVAIGGDLTTIDSVSSVQHTFKFVPNGPWTIDQTPVENAVSLTDFDRTAAEKAVTDGKEYHVKILGGIITGGKTTGGGGGIYIAQSKDYSQSGTLKMTGGNIVGNQAANGGGLSTHGAPQLTNVSIAGNHSTDQSGGMDANGEVTLDTCRIIGNTSGGWAAGAIACWYKLSMNDCIITGNKTTGDKGCVLMKSPNRDAFCVKGTTIIKDNLSNGSANNIELLMNDDDKTQTYLKLSDTLENDAEIHITSPIGEGVQFGTAEKSELAGAEHFVADVAEGADPLVGSIVSDAYGNKLVWKEGKATVTFDMQDHGAAIEAQVLEPGSKVTKPADPTAAGYTFGGWYEDKTCTGSEYDFNTPVTKSMTLYAKWTPVIPKYTITFNGNGGTVTPSTLVVNCGETVNLGTAVTVTPRSGFTHSGWALSPNGPAVYAATQKVKDLGDITLYAVWTPAAKQHQLTVNVTHGTDPVSGAAVKLRQGNVVINNSPTESPEGTYTFSNVPEGVYTIEVSNAGKTKTKAVTISGEGTVVDINLPTNKQSSVVDVKSDKGTPAVAVEGADEVAESSTEESVTITVTVEAKTDGSTPETQAEIDEIKEEVKKTAPADSELAYLDITVTKKVGETDPAKKLFNTEKVLEFIIPYDNSDKTKVIKLYRCHTTKTGDMETIELEKLSAEPETKVDGKYWLDEEHGLIHLYAKLFSTYCVGYSDASKPSHRSSSSGGSSTWLTADTPVEPKVTPTPTPTPGPVETPSVKPVNPTETPAKTPAPFLGILAGLGAAAVVFGLRRK